VSKQAPVSNQIKSVDDFGQLLALWEEPVTCSCEHNGSLANVKSASFCDECASEVGGGAEA
jgi:hypothetical protein